LPKLGASIGHGRNDGLVKTAMVVAFIGAVETNLLHLVKPGLTEEVERFFTEKRLNTLAGIWTTIGL